MAKTEKENKFKMEGLRVDLHDVSALENGHSHDTTHSQAFPVIRQPTSRYPSPLTDSYLCGSITATVFCIWALPIGALAIYYAKKADAALDKGNIKTGTYYQVRARAMFYTTVVIGFLIGMLACVYAVTVYRRSLNL